jgi:stress-induced morphogen
LRSSRLFSTSAEDRENKISEILKTALETTQVVVKDVSGGCGAMYGIVVASKLFQGKSLVQQHQLVTKLLQDEIKNMHGLTLKTVVLKEE